MDLTTTRAAIRRINAAFRNAGVSFESNAERWVIRTTDGHTFVRFANLQWAVALEKAGVAITAR